MLVFQQIEAKQEWGIWTKDLKQATNIHGPQLTRILKVLPHVAGDVHRHSVHCAGFGKAWADQERQERADHKEGLHAG